MHRYLALSAVIIATCLGRIIHVPAEYPSIQQGIDAAGAGDIVLVAPGRYVEEIRLKAGVTVRGAGEGRSIIDGGGDPGDVVSAIGNSIRNDTKLIGFTVTGAENSGGMPGGAGLFCNSGAQPEIANCRFEGNDCGIALWNGSAAFIHNCVIVHNTYDGIAVGSFATVINNTIHSNRTGFYDYSGYGPVFMNNIVTGNRLYGIFGPSGGIPPQLTYNNVWSNATDYRQAVPGIGSISHDPLYVDTLNADYRLQPGSPCIDSGNPAPQFNDPDGTRNDMGAYGGPGATTTRPRVVSLDPAINALNVPPDASIAAGFNLDIDPASLTSQSVRLLGAFSGWRDGAIDYDSTSRVVSLTPSRPFLVGEAATAFLTRAIISTEGDSLAGFTWSFTALAPGGSAVFTDPAACSVPGGPVGVVSARLNSDDNLDLAVANHAGSSIDILLGNGDGTFADRVSCPVGAQPFSICVADFNSDSALDIAAAGAVTGDISILLGNGDGTFLPAVHYQAGSNLRGICCADFNGDARLDLAAVCAVQESVATLVGNGDGTFATATRWPCGDEPSGIAAADCNCDGFADLLVTNRGAGTISLLRGLGDGRFALPTSFAAGIAPEGIAAADFNHDGNTDVAVANAGRDSVSILLGSGDGGFGSRTGFPACSNPAAVVAADFDGDGRLDLAVTGHASELTVLIGRGNGSFARGSAYVAGNDANSLACADFDSDGSIDIAVPNHAAGTCEVLLNHPAFNVIAALPAPNSTAAPETTTVAATFNQAAGCNSLNAATFRLYASQSGPHPGEIGYDTASFTVSLDPTSNFLAGEPVTAMLTTSIRSRSWVNLRGFGWNFTVRVRTPTSGNFATPIAYSAGSEVRGLWAADFDADGDVDIAATSNSPAAVVLLRNNGDGTFAAPVYTSVNSDPISLFAADFDFDGDIDLACFHNQPGTSHLEILKNDGSGSFSLYADYTPAILGQHVTGADFDADGDIDLVLGDGWGAQNNVRLMFNSGSGNFSAPVNYSAGSWARGVVCFDADNDGDFDIAVASAGTNSVTVFYNDGSGLFLHQADFGAGLSANRVYANDLNGDGFCDLAVANYGEDSVSVLMNDGTGSLADRTDYFCGAGSRALTGGDFDGDSDIDICLSAVSIDSLTVLRNNGDGTFVAPALFPAGASPWDCVTADLNSDGALDLAGAIYSSGTIAVMFGTTAGVAELTKRELSLASIQTVIRNVLLMPEPETRNSSFVLLNSAGRRVMFLAPGLNDVRHLSPGIYFIRSSMSAVSRKVILAR
uniref:Right handed beta helix domain-containing protein n=1 Tax=candidate division WOR-3 bacterium TaxID=2052148 RepID=A0A7C4GAK6_UNCW3